MKKRVFETNFPNVEKILLEKINVEKSIRLVLRNAHDTDDEDLTRNMKEIYREAPSLFSRVLSKTDQGELESSLQSELDFELDVSQSASESHKQPSAVNRIPASEVKTLEHRANEGPLPLRAGNMSDRFRNLLRLAYEQDYGFDRGHPVHLGNAAIQWSRKLSFYHGYVNLSTLNPSSHMPKTW